MSDPLSRRALFYEAARATRERAFAGVAATPRLRPPGAIVELEFLQRCTGCGDCVTACPHASIFVLRTEDLADGTPVLAPDERPCHLCDDTPCITACNDGALLALTEPPRWGYVAVNPSHCFTFRGPECGACGGLCPDEKAIRFERNRPQVDVEKCIGCGLCIAACPTSPAALRFFPVHREATSGEA